MEDGPFIFQKSEFETGFPWGVCSQEGFSHCIKCMNERISLFNLTGLTFEYCTHKHYESLTPSSSENQNVARFFKHPFFGKNDGPPWKSATFCWTCIFS
jgi:hypothetical protein